jgi:hypothetical protein
MCKFKQENVIFTKLLEVGDGNGNSTFTDCWKEAV